MDLERMLKKCREGQWSIAELDFSRPPPPLSRDAEEMVVQYFTDMAGIERMAGALFAEERCMTRDSKLKAIFRTFEADEIRHAQVAQMLADYFDVHRYRVYQMNPHLVKFYPRFVHAIRYLSPEIANIYVTVGEVLLDVALLRSLNDYLDDPTSREAITRINQDESRHLAMDYYMVAYYSSDAWLEESSRRPPRPLVVRLQAWSSFARVLYHARPFFKQVLFEPMEKVDPSGRRLKEAFKRIQLLTAREDVAARPFVRFILIMQDLFNSPMLGILAGRAVVRVLGVDPSVLVRLYSQEEYRQARTKSCEEMARETLALKYA